MSRLVLKSLLGATCLSMAVVGTANAGGFGRGTADTDIIYEEGNFNMRSSVTYVAPSREFSYHGNPALIGTKYTSDYVVPSVALKLNITDNLRCGVSHVMNNGGSIDYAAPTLSGKVLEDFNTYESALTCGVSFDVSKGRFWLLGGGFTEKFSYHRENDYSALGLGGATLDLSGTDYGYRLGAAYEIPEIALRGQVMYRTGTEYGADGILRAPAGVLAGALAAQGVPPAANPFLGLPAAMQVPVDALGEGRLPQSVEIKLQSGIAPGWLAFGSVKWTDWSATTTLDVKSASGIPITSDLFYWRDGWTVTGGVGHAFSDTVSGLLAFTYDRGVGTGWDLSSDTYTVSGGASFKDKIGGELRVGGGITYITSAEETRYAAGTNSSVDAGWAFAGSLGYAIKW